MDEIFRTSTNIMIEKISFIFLFSHVLLMITIYLLTKTFPKSSILNENILLANINDSFLDLNNHTERDEIQLQNIFNTRKLSSLELPNLSSNSTLDNNYDIRIIKFYENLSLHSFIGKWKSSKKFFNFINDEGRIRVAFQHAFGKDDQLLFYSFLILISDGENNDNWLIIRNHYLISLKNRNMTEFNVKLADNPNLADKDELNNYYVKTHQHNYTADAKFTVTSDLTNFEKFNYIFEIVLNLNFTTNFECDISGKNIDAANKMKGKISSQVFDLDFEVQNEQDSSIFTKISKFSLIMSFLGLMQLFNFKHLADKFAETETIALKYSSYMIMINSLWNLFLSYLTFYIAIYDEKLFNDFIIPAIIYFIVFNGLEIKVICSIWRAEIFRDSTLDYAVKLKIFRNKLMKFYLVYYMTSIIIFLYALHIFFWNSFVITMTAITWIPQILRNFQNGRRKKIDLLTIGLLYYQFCPYNFMNMKRDIFTSWLIISIMSFQVIILLLQRIFGMRCLIPRYFLKENTSNYYQSLSKLKKLKFDLENLNCPICLGPFLVREENKLSSSQANCNITSNTPKIDASHDLQIKHTDRYLCCRKCLNCLHNTKESTKLCINNFIRVCDGEQVETEYILTHCNHLFHTNCLKGWIELKNSCPQCRRTLEFLDL